MDGTTPIWATNQPSNRPSADHGLIGSNTPAIMPAGKARRVPQCEATDPPVGAGHTDCVGQSLAAVRPTDEESTWLIRTTLWTRRRTSPFRRVTRRLGRPSPARATTTTPRLRRY